MTDLVRKSRQKMSRQPLLFLSLNWCVREDLGQQVEDTGNEQDAEENPPSPATSLQEIT